MRYHTLNVDQCRPLIHFSLLVNHLKLCTHQIMIACIYNLNSYLISLIFMLILCNYDACYLNFMNFLHWNVILLKFIFMHTLGIII